MTSHYNKTTEKEKRRKLRQDQTYLAIRLNRKYILIMGCTIDKIEGNYGY